MDSRVSDLIATLALAPHPEGGYFREIHRGSSYVHPEDGRRGRSALTVIYFLLAAGQTSRWHRVLSDEAWHFHEGSAIELLIADGTLTDITVQRLGPLSDATQPVRVVNAGSWQAARCTGSYALVSCAVGPGFEFEDFEMLRDQPDKVTTFRTRWPELAQLV